MGHGLCMVVADHGHHGNQYSFDSFKAKKEFSKESHHLIFENFVIFIAEFVPSLGYSSEGAGHNPVRVMRWRKKRGLL